MITKERILTVTKNKLNASGTLFVYSVSQLEDSNNYDVPMDENNTDYQEILKWVAEGNTITDNGAE